MGWGGGSPRPHGSWKNQGYGRSPWLGALGDSGSLSSGLGSPLPALAQGASQAGLSPHFYATKAGSATTEASTISVPLWQWRGRAAAPPPTPEGSPELRQSHGLRWDALPGVCRRGEVVLLSRPFWMLMQQLTTAVQFCVICWMTLHVNCRPK